jgi:hypothetical protein
LIEQRLRAKGKARKAAAKLQEKAVKPVDIPKPPILAAPPAVTSPDRPPILIIHVPSISPPRPKTHSFFDKPSNATPIPNHEELFRAAVTYHATVRSPRAEMPKTIDSEKSVRTPVPRRTKLLRTRLELSTVEVQTEVVEFRNAETQTTAEELLTKADLRKELQFWLGFLVHLH